MATEATDAPKEKAPPSRPNYELMQQFEHPDFVTTVAFSGMHTNTIVTGCQDGNVRIFKETEETDKWAQYKTVETCHKTGINYISWPRGVEYFGTCGDTKAAVWDKEGNKICETTPHPKMVMSIAFCTALEVFYTSCFDGKVREWSSSGELRHTFEDHKHAAIFCSCNHKGDQLATSGFDGKCFIYDTPSRKLLVTVDGTPDDPVCFSQFSANGKFLLVGYMGTNTVKLVQVSTGITKRVYSANFNEYASVGELNGSLLFFGSHDGTLNTVIVSAQDKLQKLKHHSAPILQATCKKGALWVADGSMDKFCNLYKKN